MCLLKARPDFLQVVNSIFPHLAPFPSYWRFFITLVFSYLFGQFFPIVGPRPPKYEFLAGKHKRARAFIAPRPWGVDFLSRGLVDEPQEN